MKFYAAGGIGCSVLALIFFFSAIWASGEIVSKLAFTGLAFVGLVIVIAIAAWFHFMIEEY